MDQSGAGVFSLERELELWRERIEAGNKAYSERRYTACETLFLEAFKQAEHWSFDGPEEESKPLRMAFSKSINNLAALYHTQGKYAFAEDLYQKAIDLNTELFGKDNPDIALNLQNLAACHSALRNYPKAEALFKEALAIREAAVGADHRDLITTLENLALLLKKLERPDEAHHYEQRLEKIKAAVEG
jgi:tetratricopeptide (TPR) repeat protein